MTQPKSLLTLCHEALAKLADITAHPDFQALKYCPDLNIYDAETAVQYLLGEIAPSEGLELMEVTNNET